MNAIQKISSVPENAGYFDFILKDFLTGMRCLLTFTAFLREIHAGLLDFTAFLPTVFDVVVAWGEWDA